MYVTIWRCSIYLNTVLPNQTPAEIVFADDGDNECNSMQYHGLSRDHDLRKFISALSITVHKLSGNKTVLLQKTGLDALVIDNMRKL